MTAIPDLLWRWIDPLAAVYFGWQEQRRAQRALVVARDGDKFIVQRREHDRDTLVATVPVGARSPEVWQAARGRLTTFELAAGDVVTQRITVPAQARAFVPGIIRNQIDRLSPWPREQAAYGFDARPNPADAGTLDVAVLITARQTLETAQSAFAAAGLTVDRIGARLPTAPDTMVTIWSRRADASPERQRAARHTIAGAIGATMLVAVAIGAWAFVSAGAIADETEAVETQIARLERSIRGGSSAAVAGQDPAHRIWNEKAQAPSAVLALEALSKALPDSAYVTELDFDRANLRLVGLADDAPSLIAPLEKSGSFTAVHFFAPTTRGPDGARFWFHIEARFVQGKG